MKTTDCSFDSEAECYDSDSETIVTIIEKPESHIKNFNIINSINKTLSKIIEANKNLPNYTDILKKQSKACFTSKSVPDLSLFDYLIRIQKYSLIEKNTLILSLIYIDRLVKIGNIILTEYNIHRIIFAAILIAIKFNEDEFFDNDYYAKIAGIKTSELIIIEYNFICMCEFNMYVDEEIFEKYNKYLSDNIYNNSYSESEHILFLEKKE